MVQVLGLGHVREAIQAAVAALQAILDAPAPDASQESTTTEKGHRMRATDELITLAHERVARNQSPSFRDAVASIAKAKPDLFARYQVEQGAARSAPATCPALAQLEAMVSTVLQKSQGLTRGKVLRKVMATEEGKRLYNEYIAHQQLATRV
jgi:hypothetical protein